MKKLGIFFSMLLFCVGCVFCQLPENEYRDKRPIDPQGNYWDNIDAFLNRQSQACLDVVREVMQKYPPQLGEPIERRLALLTIDAVMHDEKAPARPAVQARHVRADHVQLQARAVA